MRKLLEATLSISFFFSLLNQFVGLGLLIFHCVMEFKSQLGEPMTSIIATYRLPSVRHVFLIVSPPCDLLDSLSLSEEIRLGREYFERIHRSKDRKRPKVNLRWTIKIVCIHDFLEAIKQHIPKGIVLPSQSSHNPEELELLTINLLKNHQSVLDRTFDTPKVLSAIPDEDIIEVFI